MSKPRKVLIEAEWVKWSGDGEWCFVDKKTGELYGDIIKRKHHVANATFIKYEGCTPDPLALSKEYDTPEEAKAWVEAKLGARKVEE